jgi:hypothetical protein
MNRKYLPLLDTLSSMEVARLKAAAEAEPATHPTQAASGTKAVPEGRTTFTLSRKGGTVAPVVSVPAKAPDRSPAPPAVEPIGKQAAAHDADGFGTEDETTAGRPTAPARSEPDIAPGTPGTFPEETDPADIDQPPPAPKTEAEIALAFRAKPRKPKAAPLPEDKILMNFRIEKYLKDAFFKTCQDQDRKPSLVLRNFMKSFCGLCLILAVLLLSPTAATAQAQQKDTSYTTDQIMAYLQSKAFGGLGKNVPGAKGTIGARHALWQTGASDPINDFVYSDYSNTRLEAKIEIPIFDLSYLRNKDREKLEHRAFVMKALSKILAAQKAVKVTENQIFTMNQRRDYINNQVNLRIANRSDIFPIEDKLFSLQSQLFEAQSTLEQRVIELAILAENDWQEAYRMIIKWDGILFAPVKKK